MEDDIAFKRRAIFLAAVCEQAYAQFTNPDGSFVIPADYSVCYTFEAKSMNYNWERFGFIIESPTEIILAFRGTISTTNWISDIIASQKKFKYVDGNCLTHRGFTGIYSSARDGIMSALAKLSPDKTLYITGHSLGAALATLCAIDVAANSSYTSPRLYTYGSPRVGDPAFARNFAKYVPDSYRIANLFDVITIAPPPIYQLPRSDKKYYYTHVRTLSQLTFLNGIGGSNHVISSYFAELAKYDPEYAQSLCAAIPGFCPVPEAGEELNQGEALAE